MMDFSLEEAQLYRMLVGFFGRDRIVPNMSVLAVCGGELPQPRYAPEEHPRALPADLGAWAKGNRCLFTVVDGDDSPKMVLDFEAFDKGSGGHGTVDPEKLEYQRIVRPLLQAAGVRFFTITNDEFSELLRPAGNLDLFNFFKDRFEELGFSIGPDPDA